MKLLVSNMMLVGCIAISLIMPKPCVMAASPSGKPAAVKAPPEKTATVDQLPALCLAAKALFHPLTKNNLLGAKKNLTDAVERLDQKMKSEGAEAAKTQKYLGWTDFQKNLALQTPDTAELRKVNERLLGGIQDSALVWYADVRVALRTYLEISAGLDNPNLKTDYEARLDRLAARLQSYIANPTAEAALPIGSDLSWLEDLRQAPEAIKAVREQLARPNLYAVISADLLNAGISARVSDVRKIRDCILGVDICGTGHTSGMTNVSLIPDPNKGVAETILRAKANTDSVGVRGKINVYSNSVSTIESRKRLLIDVNGLRAVSAVSRVGTDTTINDIQHDAGRRMVEHIAWNQACKKRDLAECIASEHTKAQINEQVDAEADKMIREANENFDSRFRNPLTRYNVFPQMVRFSTQKDAIRMVALEADASELAAPTAPPAVGAEADVVVQIHESMINNFATTALADNTLLKEKLYDLVLEVTRDPDRADEMTSGEGEWSMKFAHLQPLSVNFADDGIKIAFRGAEFYKDKNAPPYEAMNVSAEYKFEKTPAGYKATRGELEILPPRFAAGKGKQLSAGESGAIPVLRKRFQKMFAPEILIENMEVYGKWSNVGKLQPVRLISENGWLTIAWKRLPPDKPVEKSVASK
jgi:hypothetical protein